jgi:hypothetical protein
MCTERHDQMAAARGEIPRRAVANKNMLKDALSE